MSSKPNHETTLALPDPRLEPWRDPEWQRLWLALQVRPWRSLALVPAASGAPKDFALRIALILSRTGMVHLGRPIQVADATNVPLAYLTQLMDEVSHCTKDGDVILVALAPAGGNPVTVPIARAMDAAILCVLLERMSSSEMKKTVAQIGANRFVGSSIFRADDRLDPGHWPGTQPAAKRAR